MSCGFQDDDVDEDYQGPSFRIRLVGGPRDGEVQTPPEECRHLGVPAGITTPEGNRYRVDLEPTMELIDGDRVYRANYEGKR